MSVELEKKIIKVANGWGLYENTTVEDQIEKLMEEVLELEEAIEIGNMGEVKLELGDCMVVLINIAAKMGISLEMCGYLAYEKIRTRTGKMINGKFVREK